MQTDAIAVESDPAGGRTSTWLMLNRSTISIWPPHAGHFQESTLPRLFK
jgi:hypothetical protein